MSVGLGSCLTEQWRIWLLMTAVDAFKCISIQNVWGHPHPLPDPCESLWGTAPNVSVALTPLVMTISYLLFPAKFWEQLFRICTCNMWDYSLTYCTLTGKVPS